MSHSRRTADDPAPWTVLASRYLHRRPPWLVLREDHVRLPSGAEIPAYWVNEFAPWVNVVAVTQDQHMVLLRQYRHGLGQVHFEIPAGATDFPVGASPSLTEIEGEGRRELLEETGYGQGRWSHLMSVSANPALTSNLTHTFLAEGVEKLEESRPEATEDLRLHLVPVEEVLSLIDGGGFSQALHVAPILRYLLSRKRL